MKTLRLHFYTGTWNARLAAGKSSGLSVGDVVLIHEACDEREYNDLKRLLYHEGLRLDFDEGDGPWNLYDVIAAGAKGIARSTARR